MSRCQPTCTTQPLSGRAGDAGRVVATHKRSWAVPRPLVASRTQRLNLRRPRAASEEDVEPADMAQLVRTPVLGRGAGTFDATASLAEDIERCARVLSYADTDAPKPAH